MKILVASPVAIGETAGPATILNGLVTELTKQGDTVTIITLSTLEKKLPVGVRQLALFFRAIPACLFADGVMLLDPASTGPAVSLAACITRTTSVLRIGGDFLWESYVERTHEPVLLSDFYSEKRNFTLREKSIMGATRLSLSCATSIVFSTQWQRDLWLQPYFLSSKKITVIHNPLPQHVEAPRSQEKNFLCAHRNARIKNAQVMSEVWKLVNAQVPDAMLDETNRSPEEYKKALASCYAVIVPSLSDVSPNTALEALAYGKPAIVTKDTGIGYLVSDALNFVDTRRPEDIAEAVIALCQPEIYERVVAAAGTMPGTSTWHEFTQHIRSLIAR